MSCLHCGAPDPKVADQICVPCAADAALGRMLFAEYRFLYPGELVTPDAEYRLDHEADDWHTWDPEHVQELKVPSDGCGRYRRRLRLYRDGQRYLDEGEHLNAQRDTPLGDVPSMSHLPDEEVAAIAVTADAVQRFARPMYATFPNTGCACSAREPLVYGAATQVLHDPPEDASPEERERLMAAAPQAGPTICVACGRVWATLEAGQKPDAFYPEGQKPDPTCECKDVRPYPPTSVRLPPKEVRAAIQAALGGQELSPESSSAHRVGPFTTEVQCTKCGQVFARSAWDARKSAYPDLQLPVYSYPKKLSYFEASKKRQGVAVQRTLRRYERAKWARLRDRAAKLLGEDTAQRIDGVFDQIDQMTTHRAGKPVIVPGSNRYLGLEYDTVADHHTDEVIDLAHDLLEDMRQQFTEEAVKAQAARLTLIDEELVRLGGEPFFAATDPHQAPLTDAMTQLAARLRHFFQTEFPEDDARDILFRFATKNSDPDKLQEACIRAYDKGDTETKALAVALRERISFMERDPGLHVTLADEIVQATTLELPPPHSLDGLVDKAHWPSKVWHNLAPGEFVCPGDLWREPGTQNLRPAVSSVGKPIPMPMALQVLGDANPKDAIPATTPFVRPIHGKLDTVAPDPYAEFTMFQTYAGHAETLPAPANETTHVVTWPKYASAEGIEVTLRELYKAVGLEVRSLVVDEKLKLVHLALTGRDGLELAIAVPLPSR